jgi:hypothetical protein
MQRSESIGWRISSTNCINWEEREEEKKDCENVTQIDGVDVWKGDIRVKQTSPVEILWGVDLSNVFYIYEAGNRELEERFNEESESRSNNPSLLLQKKSKSLDDSVLSPSF